MDTLDQLRHSQRKWADTPEKLMGVLVDMIAENPQAVVDQRAWEQLLIYAPKCLAKRPVAFRIPDHDGWIILQNEQAAQIEAEHRGVSYHGLYARGAVQQSPHGGTNG